MDHPEDTHTDVQIQGGESCTQEEAGAQPIAKTQVDVKCVDTQAQVRPEDRHKQAVCQVTQTPSFNREASQDSTFDPSKPVANANVVSKKFRDFQQMLIDVECNDQVPSAGWVEPECGCPSAPQCNGPIQGK